MLCERIEYSNWIAETLLTVMNYSLQVRRHVNHTDKITNTTKDKRYCRGWTQFAAAINKVAKGNWVIIMCSYTIYIARKHPGHVNGRHGILML